MLEHFPNETNKFPFFCRILATLKEYFLDISVIINDLVIQVFNNLCKSD